MSSKASTSKKSSGGMSPQMAYGIAALGISAAVALLLYVWLGWDLYWLWLLVVNVVTFLFYRYDKRLSKHEGPKRVPEVVLLLLPLLGGFVGAGFGMYMQPRHKTQHVGFVLVLILSTAIHAGLIYFLYLR